MENLLKRLIAYFAQAIIFRGTIRVRINTQTQESGDESYMADQSGLDEM